jgi:hypothetical protein
MNAVRNHKTRVSELKMRMLIVSPVELPSVPAAFLARLRI